MFEDANKNFRNEDKEIIIIEQSADFMSKKKDLAYSFSSDLYENRV